MAEIRSVDRIYEAQEDHLTPELAVRRILPLPGHKRVDPFLLLHHIGPLTLQPAQQICIPAHPHRGFQAVTLLLEGHIEHRDNQNEAVQLEMGDVHWIRAGSGIVHKETLDSGNARGNGRLHALQFWINLPSRMKMSPPIFRKIAAREIPALRRKSGHWVARVLAGDLEGLRGPVRPPTPLAVMRITILQDSCAEVPVSPEFNACCYIIRGTVHSARFGPISGGTLLHYKSDGNTIALEAQGETELLLLAGKPLNEPVASHGPFVMNRYQELHQALTDYQSGRMGRTLF